MTDGAKTGTEERIKQILTFINETPRVLSLLYDLGLLPEQLSRSSREWSIMCQLVDAEMRVTEALKVAGELGEALEEFQDPDDEYSCDCGPGEQINQPGGGSYTTESGPWPMCRSCKARTALAALERIRKP